MLSPPKLVKPYVISFCRSIVPNPQPVYVPVKPANVEPDSCFTTVPIHVADHGGKEQIGWTIWEWQKVMIEAEFHAIWISPTGEPVDITPKQVPVPRILFLPDSRRVYRGRQVDNYRKPLRRDGDLNRFLEICRLLHLETNKGNLAEQHGKIPLSPLAQRYLVEKNQLCALLYRRYGVPESETPPQAAEATSRAINALAY